MGFGHFGTPGQGSRLHGSTFQRFADFAVTCGQGFPDGEPGFPEGLPEKGRDLKRSGGRSKNNEAPHANSAMRHGGGLLKIWDVLEMGELLCPPQICEILIQCWDILGMGRLGCPK